MEALEAEVVEVLEQADQADAGMLWTGGKDSMVMLDLYRRHIGDQPPLLVVDTTVQFEEIYDFRERIADEWDLEYNVRSNEWFIEEALTNPADERDFAWDGPKTEGCCGALKIDVIGDFIAQDGFDHLTVGRRSADVPGELPLVDAEMREPMPHTRYYPLANWSDAHIGAYLTKHSVPLPSLYDEGYEHTDCEPCVRKGEEGDDWSGASPEQRQQLQELRDMGYM